MPMARAAPEAVEVPVVWAAPVAVEAPVAGREQCGRPGARRMTQCRLLPKEMAMSGKSLLEAAIPK